MKRILLYLSLIIPFTVDAQQYSGMSGLIHVPSADMDSTGDARIGAHFLNKHFLPDSRSFEIDGEKYNSFDAYLSLTPFWWVEVGFAMTFERGTPGMTTGRRKFAQKDRYLSVKFNPLREGRYYPAIALGVQDCASVWKPGKGIFSNYYVAATKHLDLRGHELGATLAYRHYPGEHNRRWDGVVGGLTYRPRFAKNWRAIVEWTGCDVNVGIDCLLWRHLLLQASLQDGRYPSGGICYKVNLF